MIQTPRGSPKRRVGKNSVSPSSGRPEAPDLDARNANKYKAFPYPAPIAQLDRASDYEPIRRTRTRSSGLFVLPRSTPTGRELEEQGSRASVACRASRGTAGARCIPQNSTFGASFAPAGASKYGFASNPNTLAMMFVGNLLMVVL